MKKICIQNLGIIATNKCNLNCGHCLRGKKNNSIISKEVIDATLRQIIGIGNLNICGGEVVLAVEEIEEIFNYIVDNRIILENVSITINGTKYSWEFLKLLDYINTYIESLNGKKGVHFTISYDRYHLQEIERLKLMKKFIENVEKYGKSKYFGGLRELDPKVKLFREGNACNLERSLTVKLKPIELLVTYVDRKGKFDREGLCNIGPLITINPEGIITEDNASIENQRVLYNYGNVLNDSIEEVAIKRGKIVKPDEWNRKTKKIIKKYVSYNK